MFLAVLPIFFPRLEFYNEALYYFSIGNMLSWNQANSACTGGSSHKMGGLDHLEILHHFRLNRNMTLFCK